MAVQRYLAKQLGLFRTDEVEVRIGDTVMNIFGIKAVFNTPLSEKDQITAAYLGYCLVLRKSGIIPIMR